MDQHTYAGWRIFQNNCAECHGAAARDALIEDVINRRQGEIPMPAWDGDPNVKSHVVDLCSHLRARADGALGDSRPQPAR